MTSRKAAIMRAGSGHACWTLGPAVLGALPPGKRHWPLSRPPGRARHLRGGGRAHRGPEPLWHSMDTGLGRREAVCTPPTSLLLSVGAQAESAHPEPHPAPQEMARSATATTRSHSRPRRQLWDPKPDSFRVTARNGGPWPPLSGSSVMGQPCHHRAGSRGPG